MPRAANVSDFQERVLKPISAMSPRGTTALDYKSYMALPESDRSGDEASFVDSQFTPRLLEWLGWSSSDWHYNAPETGGHKNTQRPDFRIVTAGVTAFIVENKNTTEEWGIQRLPQIRKYVAGTNAFALWTNGDLIRLVKLGSGNGVATLAQLSAREIAEGRAFPTDEFALATILDLLSKDRFTRFAALAQKASSNPSRMHLTETRALEEFIAGAQDRLTAIGHNAASQVYAALSAEAASTASDSAARIRLDQINDALAGRGWPAVRQAEITTLLKDIQLRFGQLSDSAVAIERVPKNIADKVTAWQQEVLQLDSQKKLRDIENEKNHKILNSLSIWRRLQPDSSNASVERFSEQVSYVLFVRLLLVRVLEDKQILPERIVANGGFAAWRELIARNSNQPVEESTDIAGDQLLSLVYRTVSRYYGHFFDQPIFDWFEVDDYSLVALLSHLNYYEFSDISDDVIGFTYERYIDRANKKQKGQFLTRSGIVNYILDDVSYKGPLVIGKKLIDPACGSGSFLIHATRRLRRELLVSLSTQYRLPELSFTEGQSPSRIEFARTLIGLVEQDIVGMDLDPFACYLAELNLFVQVLDELGVLWGHGELSPISRFSVFNTDSLALPEEVLAKSIDSDTLDLAFKSTPIDDGWEVKSLTGRFSPRFDFVVANPPFVSSKKQPSLSTVLSRPFYAEDAISHDGNLYLCFLRLAEYLLAENGRASIICPVTLVGDDSGEKVRKLLTSGRIRLTSLTRFTSATVLFADVDQWMMIVGFEVAATDPTATVRLRHGMDEVEAAADEIVRPISDVVGSGPKFSQTLSSEWRNPWLVVAEDAAYNAWKQILNASEDYIETLFGESIVWSQGDVNTTKAKPFRTSTPSTATLPTYTGGSARPFAPLLAGDGYVKVPSTRPDTGVGSTIFDLGNLPTVECGFLIGAQMNMHVGRRLKGTWFGRGPNSSFVAYHSLWRVKTSAAEQLRAKALFGLVTSALINYSYALWSTNFNVQKSTLFRLPCPGASTFPLQALASAVDVALDTTNNLYTFAQLNSARIDNDTSAIFDIDRLLEQNSAIPTCTLRHAILNGTISMAAGISMRVGRILSEGRLQSPVSGYAGLVEEFLRSHTQSQWESVLDSTIVPRSDAVARWNTLFNGLKQQALTRSQAALDARLAIDDIVFDWYSIPQHSPVREVIKLGVPWEYRRARARNRSTVREATAAETENLSSTLLDDRQVLDVYNTDSSDSSPDSAG